MFSLLLLLSNYHAQQTVEGSVFGTVSLCFFCLSISGTAEWICAKFTRKMCLVPRSDEFEGQGQSSRSPWTKMAFFGPFSGLHVVYVW